MTTEEKQLLLKDLCARLPYGVIMNYKDYPNDSHTWKLRTLNALPYSKAGIPIDTDWDGDVEYVEYPGCGMSTASRPISLEKNLPYLRSLSRMTKKEVNELKNISNEYIDEWVSAETSLDRWKLDAKSSVNKTNFYCSHHLDWNGLIEKGLALEAPEGMYETK